MYTVSSKQKSYTGRMVLMGVLYETKKNTLRGAHVRPSVRDGISG